MQRPSPSSYESKASISIPTTTTSSVIPVPRMMFTRHRYPAYSSLRFEHPRYLRSLPETYKRSPLGLLPTIYYSQHRTPLRQPKHVHTTMTLTPETISPQRKQPPSHLHLQHSNILNIHNPPSRLTTNHMSTSINPTSVFKLTATLFLLTNLRITLRSTFEPHPTRLAAIFTPKATRAEK